ncbi:hypothetical protein PRNP1_011646 [Phytophthora ramorum]
MRKCSRRPTEDAAIMPTPSNDMEFARDRSEPLYRPSKTGLTRSSHNAPSASSVEERMAPFWEWLQSPSAAGKTFNLTNPKAYFDKFRTVLGKLAKFHDIDINKIFYKMNRIDCCSAMFSPEKFNAFTMWLGKKDNGEPLALRTIYNYLNTLKDFFEWKVKALGKEQFAEAYRLTAQVCKNLSLQKDKRAQDISKKAARLEKMPKMPQFQLLMSNKLKSAVDDVGKAGDYSWKGYETCRDYFLMVLMFGVPPQRKQFLERMEKKNIESKDKYTIIKVLNHKTERRYGPVTVLLPPAYYEHFQLFIDIWWDHRTLRTDNIFITAKGEPDTNLTRHFQRITQAEFGVDVSLRDCRSIFINHAKKRLDMTQMYELSRQMCHSFQVQQSEYRADDTFEHASSVLATMAEHLGAIPLCDVDAVIYQDELAELEVEEATTTQGDETQ